MVAHKELLIIVHMGMFQKKNRLLVLFVMQPTDGRAFS